MLYTENERLTETSDYGAFSCSSFDSWQKEHLKTICRCAKENIKTLQSIKNQAQKTAVTLALLRSLHSLNNYYTH